MLATGDGPLSTLLCCRTMLAAATRDQLMLCWLAAQLHAIWGQPRAAADCLGTKRCFLPLKIPLAMKESEHDLSPRI